MKTKKRIFGLANHIARDIFSEGDGPTKVHRIQFLGGHYPDQETNQGGFNEEALANCIARSLMRHAAKGKNETD